MRGIRTTTWRRIFGFILFFCCHFGSSLETKTSPKTLTTPTTTPAYDPKLGYQMFLYSAIAYTNPEENITPWKFYEPTDCNLLTEGFNVDGWAQNVDTKAFAFYGSNPHTKEAIIAFKGSNETEDWIYDLRTSPVHYKKPCNIKSYKNITTDSNSSHSHAARAGVDEKIKFWRKKSIRKRGKGKLKFIKKNLKNNNKSDNDVVYMGNVHVGFCEYFQSFASIGFFDDIEAIMSYYQEHDYTIYSVGHSLGGAMASMLSTYYNIKTNSQLNVNVYTYGEPRVGDVSFAFFSQLNTESLHYRVIHSADIVPHLSLCCRGTTEGTCSTETYCPLHGGVEIWYDLSIHKESMSYDSNYTICSNIPTTYNSSVVGEDPSCSDSLGKKGRSPEDHQYYYGKDVGSYCLDGKTVPNNELAFLN